jgi:adenine-specific DNA-methyltransferase
MEPHVVVLRHLNALPGRHGYLTNNYSPAGAAKRLFFSCENAMRLDRIRAEIDTWAAGLLNEDEEAYLLACLLEAADRIANTAGTYYAYLKHFYRKALKPLQMIPIPISSNSRRNCANQADASALLERVRTDVVYLDPPYNDRDYGSYYHLPEALARRAYPKPKGVSGMSALPSPRSAFCRAETAYQAFENLVSEVQCRCLAVHYSTDGLISHRDILRALRGRGRTRYVTWSVRKYVSRPGAEHTTSTSASRLYICRIA